MSEVAKVGSVFLAAGAAALVTFWLAPKRSALEAWAGVVTVSSAVGLFLTCVAAVL